MDILLNNCSLTGQYASPDDFANNGLKSIIEQLKTAYSLDDIVVLKNYDFYNSRITPEYTLREILINPKIARINDTIRKYKSLLDRSCESPFWEDSKKHDSDMFYQFNDNIVTNTCLAEACERDKLLFSFKPSYFEDHTIYIIKDKTTNIELNNFTANPDFIEHLYNLKKIDFENYIILMFSKSKLDFSNIVNQKKYYIKKIPHEVQHEFVDSFKTFSELTWTAIGNHKGLRFKPYLLNKANRSYFVGYEGLSIYEFRASKKFRCFGYKNEDKFYLIYIDLEHRLGDL